MGRLRIGIAQQNCTVGDLEGNSRKIRGWMGEASKFGVDIIAFPELAITGYPPEDLLLKPKFIADNVDALRKAAGVPVPEVVSVPAEVEVQVPVVSLAQFKPDVAIKAVIRGDPASGYRKGNVLVDPASVTLEGPSWVLDALPDFVETMPITITGAVESLSRQSLLSVPGDVGVVEVSYVTVTVEILPLLGTRTLTSTMELIRVPAGMRAIPSTPEIVITLEGPDAKLVALKPDDILIVLDLRGRTRGIHLIIPDVLAPEGIRVLTVDPETVAVLIEPIPTPTPTPTAKP